MDGAGVWEPSCRANGMGMIPQGDVPRGLVWQQATLPLEEWRVGAALFAGAPRGRRTAAGNGYLERRDGGNPGEVYCYVWYDVPMPDGRRNVRERPPRRVQLRYPHRHTDISPFIPHPSVHGTCSVPFRNRCAGGYGNLRPRERRSTQRRRMRKPGRHCRRKEREDEA